MMMHFWEQDMRKSMKKAEDIEDIEAQSDVC